MTDQRPDDPLAGYKPNWRTDPLAGYSPQWRTAQAVFGTSGREEIPSRSEGGEITPGPRPTVASEIGHLLGGVAIEPAIEGITSAAPFFGAVGRVAPQFLSGLAEVYAATTHAPPPRPGIGVHAAAPGKDPNMPDRARGYERAADAYEKFGPTFERLSQAPIGGVVRTLMTKPPPGVDPSAWMNSALAAQDTSSEGSVESVNQRIRGVLGSPETPAEQAVGMGTMILTPALAGAIGSRLAGVGRTALAGRSGLEIGKPLGPLTADAIEPPHGGASPPPLWMSTAPPVATVEPPPFLPGAVAKPEAPLPSPSEIVDRLPPEMQTSRGLIDYTGPERRKVPRLTAEELGYPEQTLEGARGKGPDWTPEELARAKENPLVPGEVRPFTAPTSIETTTEPSTAMKSQRTTPPSAIDVRNVGADAHNAALRSYYRAFDDQPGPFSARVHVLERIGAGESLDDALAAEGLSKPPGIEAKVEYFKRMVVAMDRADIAAGLKQPESLAVESGAARDATALQDNLFGGTPTLVGKEQTELLGANAGIPTAKLKATKIGPEEVGRVKREGGEPEGARPAELFTAPTASKSARRKPIAKQTVDELIQAIDEKHQFLQKSGIQPTNWVRWDDDIQAMRSSAGGGIGGSILRQASEYAGKAHAELLRRGLTEEQVMARLMSIEDARQATEGPATEAAQASHETFLKAQDRNRQIRRDAATARDEQLAEQWGISRQDEPGGDASFDFGNEAGAIGVRGGPGFRSRLEESVKTAKLEKAPAQTWISKLRGKGHSAEEFDWALGSALEADPTRQWTKAELVDMAQRRGYGALTETVRRTAPTGAVSGEERAGLNPPKYGGYTEPGGTNYREVLLQVPRTQVPDASTMDYARRLALSSGEDWEALGPNGRQRFLNQANTEHPGAAFRSSHWDEPNVLAHIRLNDRVGPNGEKILHVEEIQSDWHQKGRKEGYTQRPTKTVFTVRGPNGQRYSQFDTRGEADAAISTYDPATAARLHVEERQAQLTNPSGVPNAPFKNTPDWLGLSLKRVLDEAVAGGYDAVSWTPGAKQAARYDLRKVAERVEYNPETFKLAVTDHAGENIHRGDYHPNALADVIGKEAAGKLMASPLKPENPGDAPTHLLQGQQLEIGGEGILKFYDQMLPDVLKAYGKKLGVNIEVGTQDMLQGGAKARGADRLKMIDAMAESGTPTQQKIAAIIGDDLTRGGMKVGAAVEAFIVRHGSRLRDPSYMPGWSTVLADIQEGRWPENLRQEFPSVLITPALRAAISGGQTLGKGALPILGGVVGAGIGGTMAAKEGDPEHRVRNFVLGAIAGGALGTLMGRRIEEPGTSPAMKPPIRSSKSVAEAVKSLLAPQNRTAESSLTGRIVRAQSGQQARDLEIARTALAQWRDGVGDLATDKAGSWNVPSQARDFIAGVEQGKPQATPELTLAAQTSRTLLDHWRDEIRALGTGKLEHFYENYFPHIWKDPDNTFWSKLTGRRPMQGPMSFLKKRTIPSIEEGLAAGLEPFTSNPLDLVMLKVHEMRKYVEGQRILQEMQNNGLVQTVPAGQSLPQGWARVHDKLFMPGSVTKAVPEPVANVLNNYLTPGLRGNPIYDAYMGIANGVNMSQLGLSAFHAGFTSIDAIVSRVELGYGQLLAGKPITGSKTLLGALAAPVTTAMRGSKVMAAYRNPGQYGPLWEAIANQVAEAGGRVSMDPIYGAGKAHRFLDPLGVMDKLVPRQKLGVFADLAKHEVEKLGPNPTPDAVRGAVQLAWNSVDNRLGQMVYENLFLNHAIKDVAHLTTRAVGWNIGTLRELGGGMADLARFRNTPRARYVIALPTTMYALGSLTHYLYNGTFPKTLKDAFLIPTGRLDDEGNPERVLLPSYMKDVLAYSKHPLQTVAHKAQPLLAMVADMLGNEDFYGNQIRNESDPIVQQAQQMGEYAVKGLLPFSIRNAMVQKERGQDVTTQASSFLGVTPASRDFTRKSWQQALMDIRRRDRRSLTPEQEQEMLQRQEIRQQMESGDVSPSASVDSVKAGVLTRDQLLGMVRRSREGIWMSRFMQLPVDEAQMVYDQMGPEDQPAFYGTLQRKRARAHLSQLPPPSQQPP